MAHWRYLVLAMFLLAPALLPGSQKKAFILDELIPLALGHNPLLAAQRQEIQARKSALQASRVLLNQEFEYQRGRAEAWDKTEKRTTEEISLSQNFENPFKRHSRIQWYEKDWEAAQFELQVLSLDTIFSLKSLFYRILLLRTKQDLAQKNLESISRIHELIQKRVDLGEVKPLEAIKLYVEKLKAQNELSKVRTELLLEREKLNMLLGHTLPEDFSILGTLDYAPLDQEEGALIQKALAHHPKMKEMEARLLQARHRISFVRWQRLPDFTLTGFTEKELDGRNTGVGITLDIPLWNFRSREIHEAESLYEKQAEELRALRMALSTEIKARLNQVKLSEQTLAIFHEGLLKQAEESRKVAEMSYAQGEISLEEIEHRLEKYPGMTLNMTQPIAHNLDELITGVKAQLAVKIYGENFDILKQKALQVKDLLAQIRGASDVQVEQFTGQNHIQIVLQREKIARYGINISHIQETIEAAIGGIILGQIYEEQKRFDIFLRFQPEARKDIEQIRNLLIPIPGGGQVPLSQFASIQEAVGPRMISRENNKRFITIQCNIRGRDIGGFVAEAQKEIRANVPFPPEYMIKWGGQFELQQRANRRFAVIMPLTLAL
ncbi:MAG: efflux RND transporter permease subunit, partial [Candidatus Aminicenantales bacterium]